MSENKERLDPLEPAFLTGTKRCEIHTGNNYKGPVEIKQTLTSPLVSFISNKSYEKKDKEKGPRSDPLPLVW